MLYIHDAPGLLCNAVLTAAFLTNVLPVGDLLLRRADRKSDFLCLYNFNKMLFDICALSVTCFPGEDEPLSLAC